MSLQIKDTLYRVAEEVMEKLAFLMSFPETEEASDANSRQVAAGISFSGAFTGVLVVAVSEQMLPQLTGNMLGLDDDEESTAEQQHDALKELINVICGNLMPAIAGKQDVFHIEPPQIIVGNIDEYLKVASPGIPISVTLTMEEGTCHLFLAIETS